jgi:hypothetical protein
MIRIPTQRTSIELRFQSLAKEIGIDAEYVGDGKFWIKGESSTINPDFIIKGPKIAVFCNGTFWHSPLHNSKINFKRTAIYQEATCKKHRWVPLILWEDDLKREDAKQFLIYKFKEIENGKRT